MFSAVALLGLLLALPVLSDSVVVDKSLVTLSISRKFKFSGTQTINIVKRDQARARDLHAKATAKLPTRAVINDPVSNQVFSYIASVDNLFVDTGSSNTWIGANKSYVRTPTSIPTGNNVSVQYGQGSVNGTEYLDQVTLAPGLVITNQSIGAAYNATYFEGAEGILGIGTRNLTNHTLTPDTHAVIPTVVDNLFSQGTISKNEFVISFEPTDQPSITNGEITFGGFDQSRFIGDITYSPITRTWPSSNYWGINQSVYYGSADTPILTSSAGVVDTGTTLILLSTDAFNQYQIATGAVNDTATGLFSITSSQYANLKSLYFVIAETTFELTANAQIWPRSLNTVIGGNADSIYLIVNSLGTLSELGFDLVNGYTFLERFYSVFDTTNSRVGLARTKYTNATSN